MKKSVVWFVIIVGIMLLAACSSSDDSGVKQDSDQDVTQEEDDKQMDDEQEKADDQEGSSDTDEEEGEAEGNQTGNEEQSDPSNNDATDAEKNQTEEQEEAAGDEDKANSEDELKDLGLAILNAQREEDYSYLESILGKGASMDKSANIFNFENVTYPHEMEFVQAKESDIEFRYTHKEDSKKVIAGFAVVDYETESSFTIDFVFVKENGEWKMIDMDKNA